MALGPCLPETTGLCPRPPRPARRFRGPRWMCSSAGEHLVHTEGVTGSIPVTSTISLPYLLHHSHTSPPVSGVGAMLVRMMLSTNPRLGAASFKCPYCEIVSQQRWHAVGITETTIGAKRLIDLLTPLQPTEDAIAGEGALGWRGVTAQTALLERMHIGICSNCQGMSVWLGARLIYPVKTTAPDPSPDLPEPARTDYLEAAHVLPHSPRAAAALLRLSTEKLLGHLLGKSAKIDSMIADFVKLGVSPLITNAMDVLRVTGNEAVHPGTMDNVDDQNTALSLFGLINLIVDAQITQPKHVQQLFENLPASKREGIEQRNAKVTPLQT